MMWKAGAKWFLVNLTLFFFTPGRATGWTLRFLIEMENVLSKNNFFFQSIASNALLVWWYFFLSAFDSWTELMKKCFRCIYQKSFCDFFLQKHSFFLPKKFLTFWKDVHFDKICLPPKIENCRKKCKNCSRSDFLYLFRCWITCCFRGLLVSLLFFSKFSMENIAIYSGYFAHLSIGSI